MEMSGDVFLACRINAEEKENNAVEFLLFGARWLLCEIFISRSFESLLFTEPSSRFCIRHNAKEAFELAT